MLKFVNKRVDIQLRKGWGKTVGLPIISIAASFCSFVAFSFLLGLRPAFFGFTIFLILYFVIGQIALRTSSDYHMVKHFLPPIWYWFAGTAVHTTACHPRLMASLEEMMPQHLKQETSEIVDWLQETVRFPYHWDYAEHQIIFLSKKEAVLFKLTFGGNI